MEFKNDIGKPWKYEEDGFTVVRSSMWSPPGCHPVGCGVKLYIDPETGKLDHIEGDENDPVTHGRLCPRCLAMKDYLYNPTRLLHPMKRDRDQRGNPDAWEQITWDEAYDIIAEKADYVKKTWGPEAISVFEGTGRDAGIMGTELAQNVFGSPNYATPLSGFACYQPRNTSTMSVLGAYYPEIDYGGGLPGGMDDPQFKVPEVIVVWGKNPIYSNGDGLFGHAVVDLMKRGAKIISVDPRVNWLATRSIHHLRLRPGTDTALAMAWLNVIIGEDLYDHDFVEKWCYGFDELADAVSEMTPEKAGEICGLDPDDIRDAARAYANAKPASIAWGLAIDTNWNGVQCAHCILALMSITGNIDIPGGQIIGGSEADPDVSTEAPSSDATDKEGTTGDINDAFQAGGSSFFWLMEGWNAMDDELKQKIIGLEEYPLFVGSLSVAQSDMVFDAVTEGKPYPLQMIWIHTSNFFSCMGADPEGWAKGMKENVYFNFATDLFMNPTIEECCDLVLPVTAAPEHNSVVFPHYGMTNIAISAVNKAADPAGECRSDRQICCEIGQRLGVKCFEERYHNDVDWVTYKRLYNRMKFEDLAKQVHIQPGYEYRKYEKGLLRGDRQVGFTTGSGRIELWSTMFARSGESPLPYYMEPKYSPLSDPEYAEKYPFVLTTGARTPAFFHSEQRQVPVLRELNPDPLIEINPADAAERGISDGQWVEISNHRGSARYKAKVTPAVRRKVLMAQHGWWFPEKGADDPDNPFGVWQSNVNTLLPNHLNGKLGFGAPYKNLMCDIRPLDESYDTNMEDIERKFGIQAGE
ncbi:MAG: molybdopterin-dependent oxidoreductase [Coriobacteriales bacterium]|jgi:anaerobic selenocysteine-containing dehydrogenase